MTPFDLVPRGPAVIREVIRAAESGGAIDEAPEVAFGLREARPIVIDMEVEHGAGPRLARGAGLFLDDSPLAWLAGARSEQVRHELRPVDPGLDGHEAALGVELEDA